MAAAGAPPLTFIKSARRFDTAGSGAVVALLVQRDSSRSYLALQLP
jgi:hypothetical protein